MSRNYYFGNMAGSRSAACNHARAFAYSGKTGKNDVKDFAASKKQWIKDVLFGRKAGDEAKDDFMQRMQEMPFASDFERQAKAEAAAKDVERFLRSETRKFLEPVPKYFQVGTDSVSVSPDLIFESDFQVEVIMIKTGKPDVAQKAAFDDLRLYWLNKYGQEMAAGTGKVIRVSIYFLRKDTDVGGMRPHYDEDFYVPDEGTTEGGNVVSLVGDAAELEKHFKPLMDEWLQGVEETACKAEDCAKCDLERICRFAKPPIALDTVKATKSLKSLKLTEAQEDVIDIEDGINLVIAGAGAGKTMAMALRFATLIEKGYDPSKILAITFTNNGAIEMRERIAQILDDFGIEADVEGLNIMTFNAFGDMLIKRDFKELGFGAEPQLIAEIQRSHAIKDLLNREAIEGLDYKNFKANTKNCKGALWNAKKIFEIAKKERLLPTDSDAKRCQDEMGFPVPPIEAVKKLLELYPEFDELLRKHSLIEYADQEELIWELIYQDPYYLEKLGFEHIMVDEFQDTSLKQGNLLAKLRESKTCKSVMMIGDDAQAIYLFRGGSDLILHLERIFPDDEIKTHFLVENHRSTPEIIAFGNKINEWRHDRFKKDLVATRPSGKPVTVRGFLDKKEERSYVVEQIKQHINLGTAPEDIAVLAATKYELTEIAADLAEEGIPTIAMYPVPLMENSRVQAALSLGKFLNDPSAEMDALVYANAVRGGGMMEYSEEEIAHCLENMQDISAAFHAMGKEEQRKAFLHKLRFQR